jgi:hypothetical protein
MIPDHPARLQCHSGKGQEKSIHTLWFPCRLLHGEGHCSGQARRTESIGVQIPDRLIPCKHDPKDLVLKHALQVSSYWSYTHDKFEDEVFTENSQDWDKVVARMADPKMTRLKAMSLDEQTTILEKSTQGALRARE